MDARLAKEIEDAVAVKAAELEELKTTFKTADDAKKAYDTEETRLKQAKADADNNGTEEQKTAAAEALSDHQATKAALDAALTAAKNTRDTLD